MRTLGITIFGFGCLILIALAAAWWTHPHVPHFWRMAMVGASVMGSGVIVASIWQDERPTARGFTVESK